MAVAYADRAASHDRKCAECGKPMWRTRGARPQGESYCRDCRKANPRPYGRRDGRESNRECETCGEQFSASMLAAARRKFCSIACANRRPGRVNQGSGAKLRRAQRDVRTAGLTQHQRRSLLAKWRRQRRTCTYCERPVESVDHVVPLIWGGTNYEGNLTPACTRCNSRKNGHLLIEWRTGKRLQRPGWQPRKRVTSKPKAKPEKPPLPMWRDEPCAICGGLLPRTRTTYCGRECSDEMTARITRDAYRRAHGLPERGRNVPTKPWARRQAA